MRLEPEPETAERIGWTVAALGLLLAIVSGVGEVLGWWDATGEIGITVGSVVGVLVSVGTTGFAAGRRQVGRVHRAIATTDDRVASKLNDIGAGLSEIGAGLGAVGPKPDHIDARLDPLDRIHLAREVRTAVLGRQVRLLSQIRDRM